MDHQKHIGVLLEAMRDPKFFLEYSPEQQQQLEFLLQQHQAAIAPNQAPMMLPGPEGGAEGAPDIAALLGGDQKGAAMTPAIASGFTGELGVEGNTPN